jgi:hypothetical protein
LKNGRQPDIFGELGARILTVARPDRIILFGSAGTGEMTRDSDIDLLIVEPTPGQPAREIRSGLRCHWEDRLSGRCAHYGDRAF